MAAGAERLILDRVTHDEGDCWLWRLALNNSGYGSVWLGGRRVPAHRAAHVVFKGPIPEGYDIDHLCRVKHCVNPEHLEAVTRRENMRRAPRVGRPRQTHCARGHEFTDDNSQWNMGRGSRQRRCRQCARVAARSWEACHRVTSRARASRRAGADGRS